MFDESWCVLTYVDKDGNIRSSHGYDNRDDAKEWGDKL